MFEDIYTSLQHIPAYETFYSFVKKHLKITLLIVSVVAVVGFLLFGKLFVLDLKKSVSSSTAIEETSNLQTQSESALEHSTEALYIEAAGAVRNPGMYVLSKQARINDLLTAAGGISEDADITWVAKNLMLAKHVQDEEKVYIPFLWDTQSLVASNTVTSLFNTNSNNVANGIPIESESNDVYGTKVDDTSTILMNSCTMDRLLMIKGVGDVYAKRIVDNRPYKNFADLQSKIKLPSTVLLEIEKYGVFD